MATEFYVGQLLTVTVVFTNEGGSPDDPDVVEFEVRAPNGVRTTYVSGTSLQVEHPALGTYKLRFAVTLPNRWLVYARGTAGTNVTVKRAYVDVAA